MPHLNRMLCTGESINNILPVISLNFFSDQSVGFDLAKIWLLGEIKLSSPLSLTECMCKLSKSRKKCFIVSNFFTLISPLLFRENDDIQQNRKFSLLHIKTIKKIIILLFHYASLQFISYHPLFFPTIQRKGIIYQAVTSCTACFLSAPPKF